MTVLVTGASGHLGRRAVDALLRREETSAVVAADLHAPPPAERAPGVVYEEADVRDEAALAAIFSRHGVDAVVHLAAVVTQGAVSRDVAYAVDVGGTENVLRACTETGVRKIVVSSSGAAYGYHADAPQPLTEEAPLRGNEAFAYAHHKRLAEERLAHCRTAHPELRQVVFRIGTVLGAGMESPVTALFGWPVVLALREAASPFVFVWDRDVAACLAEAALTGKTGVYNLAGDGALPVRTLAALMDKPVVALPTRLVRAALRLLRALGIGPFGPEHVDFLRYRPVLSNRRLKEDFGYVPRKSSHETFVDWRSKSTD